MKKENIPEIVTLCGSTRFKDQFMETNRKLTLEGKIVLSVGVFGHSDGEKLNEEAKRMLDELHLRKIDLSNGVYVIDVENYVGESTKKEIKYAESSGKFVRYYTDDKKKRILDEH
jgi:hypothetical protein